MSGEFFHKIYATAHVRMSVEVVSLEREHCFRHESEIKKQKKGREAEMKPSIKFFAICGWISISF